MFRVEKAFYLVVELLIVDRLGGIAVHAGFEALLTVLFHGVSSHGDYGDVLARVRLHLADDAGCFKPVHPRHFHIHENQVESVLLQYLEHFKSVAGYPHLVSLGRQPLASNELGGGVIFGE